MLKSYGNSLGKHVAWATASQVLTSAANFISAILLVRIMGIEDFGRYTVAFVTIMITRNFLNALVLVPISSLQPKLKLSSASAYRTFFVFYAGAFSLTSTMLLLLLAISISKIYGYGWLSSAVVPFALANLFANAADCFRRYFLIVEQARNAFAIDAARYFVQIVLLVALALTYSDSLTVSIALAVLALASASGTLIGLPFFGKMKYRGRFERIMWHRHWRFGRWMLPATTLDTIQGSGPLLVLGAVLGDAALGLVRAIQQVANLLNLPINTLEQILPSLASSRFVQEGENAVRRFLLISAALAVGVVGTGMGVLISISGLIINKLMGIDHSLVIPLLLAFGATALLVTIRKVLHTYLYVHELSGHAAAGSFVGATVTVILLGPCIKYWAELSVPLANMAGVTFSLATVLGILRLNTRDHYHIGVNREGRSK